MYISLEYCASFQIYSFLGIVTGMFARSGYTTQENQAGRKSAAFKCLFLTAADISVVQMAPNGG